MNDQDKGLYNKYTIHKQNGQIAKGNYFVLKPEEDEAALAALTAYAITTDNKELRQDLKEWIKRINKSLPKSEEQALAGQTSIDDFLTNPSRPQKGE